MCTLVSKYNVAGPRYTSYPTVPYWELDDFSVRSWKDTVKARFDSEGAEGISLYIHLPFCESLCTFCGCHKRITKRHEMELPYLKAVVEEWKMYYELLGKRPVIRELHIGGGTPTFFSPENLDLLLSSIFSYAKLHPEAELSFEGHPNNTTKEHLQTLYDLGFRRVCFGVQDYSEKVQKAIHRIQTLEEVRNVTEWARAVGYTSVGHDIIYGLPFQTEEDVVHTMSCTAQIKPDRIAYYSYAHVPWQKGNGQRGYKDENLPSAYEKNQQQELGRKLLTEMGYMEIGMDHYALDTDSLAKAAVNENLHRNFMGYTTAATPLMIGLGVSSISDSWHAFAQNVKNIEEYQDLVSQKILPVYKGHLLTDMDEKVRIHILNLMCHFKTDFSITTIEPNQRNNILARLDEFIKDKLLTIEGDQIKVTSQGKRYIRNIAMAFDLRLHAKKPGTQMFSMTV